MNTPKTLTTDMVVSTTFECHKCTAKFTAEVPVVVTRTMGLALSKNMRGLVPEGWRLGRHQPGLLVNPHKHTERDPYYFVMCPEHQNLDG